MAATANAFGALVGTGERGPQVSKKTKKKKNKTASNEEAAASRSVDTMAGPDDRAGGEVDVAEACAILEDSARNKKSGAERVELWRDWTKQVGKVAE